MSVLKYRSDIDGLRAIAVLPVLLYHLDLIFPGGFIGVDVFFVISGFLISGIIIKQTQSGKFSILNFYVRRFRRILPALVFTILVVLGFSWFILLPYELSALGAQIISTFSFLSNFKFYEQISYWDIDSSKVILLHTWSLSVEEQFYLIMPWVIILGMKLRKKFLLLILALFTVSIIISISSSYNNAKFSFYMLPSRMWELLMGTILFTITQNDQHSKLPNWCFEFLAWLGLIMITFGYVCFSDDIIFPGISALLPVLGTSFIIYSNSWKMNSVGRILSWFPLVNIGLISYSLYLIHFPLIAILEYWKYPYDLTSMDKVVIVLLSIGLSVFSWYFIEQPHRKKYEPKKMARDFIVSIIVLFAFVSLGFAVRYFNGFQGRFHGNFQKIVDTFGRGNFEDFDATDKLEVGGIRNKINENPKVVILGSSHGMMYSPTISKVSNDLNVSVAFFTQNGTSPIFSNKDKEIKAFRSNNDEKRKRDIVVKKWIQEWRPDLIFIFARWDVDLFDTSENLNIDSWEDFRNTIGFLEEYSDRIYVALQPPILYEENIRTTKYLFNRIKANDNKMLILKEPNAATSKRKHIHSMLKNLENDNLVLFEPSIFSYENYKEPLTYFDDGGIYYYDEDHLSYYFVEKLEKDFVKILSTLKRNETDDR